MGLLNRNSKSDYIFTCDSRIGSISVYDNDRIINKYPIYNRDNDYNSRFGQFMYHYGITSYNENHQFSLNKLLSIDLNEIQYDKYSAYNDNTARAINNLRLMIDSLGLINDIDKDYLTSIGFRDEDSEVLIEDLHLNAKLKKVLREAGYIYLWQLLVTDARILDMSEGIGSRTIVQFNTELRTLGYEVRNMSEFFSGFSNDEETILKKKQLKVMSSIKRYKLIIEENKKKLEEAEKELVKINRQITK